MDKIVQDYYRKEIIKLFPAKLNESENKLGFKIFKSMSYSIWSDSVMDDNLKREYLDDYNKSNLIKIILNTIKFIKDNNIDNTIIMRDLTSVPTDWLFYNQKIKHKNDVNDDMITIFKTNDMLSTGDLKIGTQEGVLTENGEIEFSKFEKAVIDDEKCYAMLSLKETKNLSTNEITKNVFFDYYLGNDYIQ